MKTSKLKLLIVCYELDKNLSFTLENINNSIWCNNDFLLRPTRDFEWFYLQIIMVFLNHIRKRLPFRVLALRWFKQLIRRLFEKNLFITLCKKWFPTCLYAGVFDFIYRIKSEISMTFDTEEDILATINSEIWMHIRKYNRCRITHPISYI